MLKTFIAMSLDGFIAGVNDDLSFLEVGGDNDFGYEAFYTSCDAVVMGHKTYMVTKDFDKLPFETLPTYVVRSDPKDAHEISYEAIETLPHKSVFILGGGILLSSLIKEHKIGHIELFIIPKIIGEGIPLFKSIQASFDIKAVTYHNESIAQLTLVKKHV